MKLIENHYKKIGAIFFIIYLIYLLNSFFPVQTFFNPDCLDKPITQDDYVLHFIESLDSSLFFKSHYSIWGYNPYYFAGYPSGVFLAIDNHWAFLFGLILGGLFNSAFVFNLSIFIAYLILPLLAFFTARNFKLGKINSLFFFIFSMFFITGFGMMRDFLVGGIYGFVLAIFLSFYTSSLFFKYINKKSISVLVKLTFFGSLAFFVHPLSAMICLILCVPLFFFYFQKFDFKDFYKLLLCLVIILFLNLLWIVPLLKFLSLLNGWPDFQTYNLPILDLLKDSSFILILGLFLFFLYKSVKNKDYKFGGGVFISFLIFFIILSFGSQIGLSNTEPYRFVAPLVLLSILSVSKLFKNEFKEKNIFFLLILGALLISLVILPINFTCGYNNPEARKILDFIKMNTTENARVHVQDSISHPYFDSHFTAFIPYATSREILAGPYTKPGTKFKFTQFINDKLFEKNLEDIADTDLKEYLELYNIKYFLIFSKTANDFFSKNSRFKKVFNLGTYSIYEYLDSDESFCYRCNANIKSDYSSIIVGNASSNVTILKYHYIKTLKIKPESLIIQPIKILDDPVPFIKVENGDYSNFIIYNN